MHILLTGSCGSLGSVTLLHLLTSGHRVTSIDLIPLPENLVSQLPSNSSVEHVIINLCDYAALDELFKRIDKVDGLIHLGAIPNPLFLDARQVHGDNVLGAYNVMKTAIDHGVKRIVQASSVNAVGLSYTPEGRQMFDELPIDESVEYRPMDPYALSKQINEIQATSLSRTFHTRIASLRFHMVKPDYPSASSHSQAFDLFAWVSHESSARACLLGLTSEGWEGHEAFYIVAPDICWEGGVSPGFVGGEGLKGKVGVLEMLDKAEGLKGRVGRVRREYWEGVGRERRSPFDASKAERLLGWKHDL